jgi:hypothetical protein
LTTMEASAAKTVIIPTRWTDGDLVDVIAGA